MKKRDQYFPSSQKHIITKTITTTLRLNKNHVGKDFFMWNLKQIEHKSLNLKLTKWWQTLEYSDGTSFQITLPLIK